MKDWAFRTVVTVCVALILLSSAATGIVLYLAFTNGHRFRIESHRTSALTAEAVCRQSAVLIAASLRDKTGAERATILALAHSYIEPVSEALVTLGSPPCDAVPKK